ncbi:unnamed protein product [Paramecium primaurelia]|uniref:Transmembrane protein n=1 Tax=Paramecium primaurelia TaxID=5886 RepID=A0A8S1MYB5_PARPR|nr:unnamed protein product [Paramecium primaurelia]
MKRQLKLDYQIVKQDFLKFNDLVQRFKNQNITSQDVFKLAEEFQEQYYDFVIFKIHMNKIFWQSWGLELANIQLMLMSRFLLKMLELSIIFYKFITQLQVLQLYTCPGWVNIEMAVDDAELTIYQGVLMHIIYIFKGLNIIIHYCFTLWINFNCFYMKNYFDMSFNFYITIM